MIILKIIFCVLVSDLLFRGVTGMWLFDQNQVSISIRMVVLILTGILTCETWAGD